ncbi:sensor histidine kinase [Pseudonocardia xishanensis]|uniref:Histidine kinase/HSP90-like ATPase domain-containing protein n=1 Tax=Pseudonocardia xishanensis TaxID=630995 RepID=A0ABP8S2T2_9PSEU
MSESSAPTTQDVETVARDHARRGVLLQVALRWVLVAFVALTVAFVPPAHDRVACALIAAGYAVFALVVGRWSTHSGPRALVWAWAALFVDLAVLAALTLLTGVRTPDSWTSDVVTTGFLLLPVLAATQLRPRVCAAVVVPTTLVYMVAGIATQDSNEEPWASLLLRTAIAAGVAAGAVGLSRIQHSRVATIGSLVRVRGDLLGRLGALEERERTRISEHLHDGALQYVLAARMDLEDAREGGGPEVFDRLDHALTETTRLLRSTVAELHPAVLDKAGLAAAVRELATAAAARGGFAVDVEADWPARTPLDPLLHRTARELLANVAEHAGAETVHVTLERVGGRARLVVADDGVGIDAAAAGPAGGHIGLPSHAVRIEAAGGRMTVAPGRPGTVVTVVLPVPPTATPGSGHPTGPDPGA